MVQNRVLRRSYAPPVEADTWPHPLQAVGRLLPGRRHALCARAGQAGGDIAFGLESDVPSREHRDYSRDQFIDDLLRARNRDTTVVLGRRLIFN